MARKTHEEYGKKHFLTFLDVCLILYWNWFSIALDFVLIRPNRLQMHLLLIKTLKIKYFYFQLSMHSSYCVYVE